MLLEFALVERDAELLEHQLVLVAQFLANGPCQQYLQVLDVLLGAKVLVSTDKQMLVAWNHCSILLLLLLLMPNW